MKNARIASNIIATATVVPIRMFIFESWLRFVGCVEAELVNAPERVAEVFADVLMKASRVDLRDALRYEEDDGVEVSSVTEGMEVVEEEISTID